jgi:hypothetical protein
MLTKTQLREAKPEELERLQSRIQAELASVFIGRLFPAGGIIIRVFGPP